MAVWRLQVNTGGANVADYCLQNHVAALWAGKVLAMERFFPHLVGFIMINRYNIAIGGWLWILLSKIWIAIID